MDKQERARHLLQQYLNNTINSIELQELTQLLLEDKNSGDLQAALGAIIDRSPAMPGYREEEWEHLYRKIRDARPGREATEFGREFGGATGSRREVGRRYRLAAAAAIIFVLLGGGGAMLFLKAGGSKPVAAAAAGKQIPGDDIGPGRNKAVLTLADGSTIDLDEAKDGTIAKQGNSKLVKLSGGQLAYQQNRAEGNQDSRGGHAQGGPEMSGPEADGSETGRSAGRTENAKTAFNTISTPKGGQFQLVLPDGSKVWLNAASSLKYPTVFSGKKRTVELRGEAYFEIAPNATMPFTVNAGAQIEVLGTHFNVMAYNDEQAVKTTLLEGRVKVHSGDQSVLLAPGEQARSKDNGALTTATVDTDEAIAWKNGLFRFNEATIEEVMRQVSRWYDVEVVYVNAMPKDLFRGEIYRNVNVSKVLKVLELSGVRFTVEGKKILVQS
jgi:ferric-dicitrate binding protein FerR (iron transport regulator)